MNTILEDNAYSAAKSYALRGTILDQATLTALTESLDIDELITKLKATAYNNSVSKIKEPYTAKKIEHSCNEHVSDVHYKLMKISPGSELLSIYYLKYIARNLKIILKGKALGKSDEELREYVDLYSEELIGRRDIVIKALTAGDLQEAVNSLSGSEFSKDINDAVRIYKENPTIDIFDAYIDKAYFTQLSEIFQELDKTSLPFTESVGSKLRPVISHYIDAYNILAVLRSKLWKFENDQIKALIIEPTFDISSIKLKKMIMAENVEAAIRVLETTSYNKLIPTSFTNDADNISVLESNIKKHEYKKFNRAFVWDAFAESVSLAIIRIKEIEASNIGAIAFGIENKIEIKTIQESLIS